ncbi:DivIVA domain-containing protein [Glycomyces buryatensis]|uniref:DivIVA domain-containing protein n=1 Tax=Glycomyces buryatensis TaxID=2570927 RepID=UPI0014562C8B|nr:DivIVA domain-containing protein [Glycomyces buryatensis]
MLRVIPWELIWDLLLPVLVAAIGVWIAFSIVVWATGQDTLRDDAPAGPPAPLGESGAVTESDIGAVRFDTGARGYRTDQVDAALNRLAWEIGRRDEQIIDLQTRLMTAGNTDQIVMEEDTDTLRLVADADPADEEDPGPGEETGSEETRRGY